MKSKIPPPNFRKKNFDDLKSISSEDNMFEQKSKHLVSSSIFPPPSTILPSFDKTFDKLADTIIKIYPSRLSEDNEILLNQEQYDKLKEEIMRERENQLTAEYTNIKKDFICRYEEAMSVKSMPSSDEFMVQNIYG